MQKRNTVLLPKIQRLIATLGENIKLARLRRKLSAEQVSERAGISRPTLTSIEKGSSTVSLGAYVSVLHILGLQEDILLLAQDDVLGRKLQDASILTQDRAPKRKK
ncbi:MAG: transcriptional regulator with XRE-family HTH domain [Bacteroidia bacterium]|jgi:transcriptional regulator with XRE-family HTH domain